MNSGVGDLVVQRRRPETGSVVTRSVSTQSRDRFSKSRRDASASELRRVSSLLEISQALSGRREVQDGFADCL